MKTKLTFALLSFLFINLSFVLAQNATIFGTIKDKNTNELLPYVNVAINSNNKIYGTQSDDFGNFSFAVPNGNYTIKFSFIGYQTLQQQIEIAENENLELNVLLENKESLLETIVISDSKFAKPISEVTVSLEVIKPERLENANDTDLSQTIEKVPGVDVINGQANIRGGSGFAYGTGSRVALLMDGLPVLSGESGFPFWNFLPIENVGQIEIIKGAASALYGSSALNGIINLRTDYAKNKAETKISAFTGFYGKPKNNETGIFKYVDVDGNDIAFNDGFLNSLIPDSLRTQNINALISDSIEYQKVWYDSPPKENGITFSHKQKFGKLDVVLSGMWYDRTFWRSDDFEKRTRAYAGFRYRLNENLNFGINTNFMKNTNTSFLIWDLEEDSTNINFNPVGQYNLWSNTPQLINKGLRFTIDPFINFTQKNGAKHKLLGRIYKNQTENNTNQSNGGITNYAEYQFQKTFKKYNLNIAAGIVAQQVKASGTLFSDTISYINEQGNLDTLFTNDNYTSSNNAIYIQADKKFGEKLNASFGARIESNKILFSEKETKPVLRAGLNYQLAEFTFLRASFGQAYRFPTIAEKFIESSLGEIDVPMFGSFPISIFPNLAIESETGWSSEIGIKQGFKIGDFKGYFDASGFINKYNNMLEFTFGVNEGLLPLIKDGLPILGIEPIWEELDTVVITVPNGASVGFQSINIGNTQIIGGDFSVGATGKLFGLETNLLTGLTIIKPTFQIFSQVQDVLSSSNENVLKYRFNKTFKFDGEMKYKNFTIGQSMRYYSFMQAIDEAFNKFLPGVETFRAKNNSGTFVWDGRLQYSFLKKHTVSLICKNLLNNEYALRPAIIDAPRSFTLKYDVKF